MCVVVFITRGYYVYICLSVCKYVSMHVSKFVTREQVQSLETGHVICVCMCVCMFFT